MAKLIERLKSFNRKERYWLLREALGEHTFELDAEFRKKLGDLLDVHIPEDAYAAMDYHLDWIALALHLAQHGYSDEPISKNEIRTGQEINTNQMDVDMLVAFNDGLKTQLILLEAKVETRWTNKQLRAKIARLKEIIGDGKRPIDDFLEARLILMSPEESAGIQTDGWADWMRRPDGRPYWLELPRPEGLHKANRSDSAANRNRDGGYVSINLSAATPVAQRE